MNLGFEIRSSRSRKGTKKHLRPSARRETLSSCGPGITMSDNQTLNVSRQGVEFQYTLNPYLVGSHVKKKTLGRSEVLNLRMGTYGQMLEELQI